MSSSAIPLISVVIPTFHDWDRLALCLRALSRQSLSQDAFEVIVANNAPDDLPPDTLDVAANTRIIAAPERGSYAARNAALKEARAALIAFTDSDCIPDENWLSNAATFMDEWQDVGVVAGAINLFWKDERPTAVELCDSVFFLQQERYVADGFGATANVVTRRSVINDVGEFDASLMSGGDKEWTMHAVSAGHALEYGSDIKVQHPARSNLLSILKKSRRLAGGSDRQEKGRWQAVRDPAA
jgi:glycosyltransferase involved in cell wall biosynthesis